MIVDVSLSSEEGSSSSIDDHESRNEGKADPIDVHQIGKKVDDMQLIKEQMRKKKTKSLKAFVKPNHNKSVTKEAEHPKSVNRNDTVAKNTSETLIKNDNEMKSKPNETKTGIDTKLPTASKPRKCRLF